ncbi:Acyl-CoA thioester hydrolase [Desulforapulum autotrophicum HRM2]|uniref:Acyl-CoA thioester hydrolase n=1 Tax=Desulforapulum autotrophicum (strain ATCC 43914 / DSM 3382 / VKM B-1955 / HRM2) TaxID=177437 RepID=C0QB93_DESAH|nr:acyl-CoA thioesterase [Desulforapulum autotrophicum]ACN14892.1 Acyl-CoA thioester hydrolase [Desulforapulum autotrophicum HRM2]
MSPKTIEESSVTLSQVMQPQDANPAGLVHGGVIMKQIDNAAGVVAVRHTKKICVTASIDRLDFHNPVQIGNLVTFQASINNVGETSMEIGVRVETEDLLTGKKTHTGSAYLTFVALGDDFRPVPVPRLNLKTADQKRRNREAIRRRKARLAEKKSEKICQDNAKHCTD